MRFACKGGMRMGEKAKRNIAPMQNAYMTQHHVKEKVMAKRKKLLFRRLAIFFLLMITISYMLISTLISRNDLLSEKKMEKEKLEKTIAQLDKKHALLKDEIVKLNDDEYIAKLARSEYFLSEDGEIIFNIPKPKDKEEDESY